jgi:Holliday junction resolvase RusA-like endonuclease
MNKQTISDITTGAIAATSIQIETPFNTQQEQESKKVVKKGTYYSPTSGRYFNMKMIKRICKKFNLNHELDKTNYTVWFKENGK